MSLVKKDKGKGSMSRSPVKKAGLFSKPSARKTPAVIEVNHKIRIAPGRETIPIEDAANNPLLDTPSDKRQRSPKKK